MINATNGIPKRFVRWKILPAAPSCPIENNIREAANKTELPEERIDVKIIAFMIEATKAKPARSNTRVKGLVVISLPPIRAGLVYGIIRPITNIVKI